MLAKQGCTTAVYTYLVWAVGSASSGAGLLTQTRTGHRRSCRISCLLVTPRSRPGRTRACGKSGHGGDPSLGTSSGDFYTISVSVLRQFNSRTHFGHRDGDIDAILVLVLCLDGGFERPAADQQNFARLLERHLPVGLLGREGERVRHGDALLEQIAGGSEGVLRCNGGKRGEMVVKG